MIEIGGLVKTFDGKVGIVVGWEKIVGSPSFCNIRVKGKTMWIRSNGESGENEYHLNIYYLESQVKELK